MLAGEFNLHFVYTNCIAVMKQIGQPQKRGWRNASYEDGSVSFESFEWDEEKRRANIDRHDIDFQDATRIFNGPVLVERSDRKDEIRWVAIGILDEEVISVVYTERSKICRIISARPARRKERAAYRELYAGGA
jgi:uncharacterized protein